LAKIVLASNNPGKIKEFSELLSTWHIQVIPQAELGVEDADETGLTFIENAIIKARHAASITGLPAIADDSGLAVKALHGAPGIYSARFAGKGAASSDNIKKLLTQMENIPDDQREAHFHCVLVFMSSANDPTPLVCDGSWNGIITREPAGTDGFGYDPVFYVPTEKMTAAELPKTLKNSLSHRSIALRSLLALLPDKL
jgi:XTP/dITP diphosphohydrolase